MYRKLILVGLFGVISIHAWGIGFSPAFHQLYLLAGSPEHPARLQWYPAAVGLSFLFGFIGAFPCKYIAPYAGASTAVTFLAAASLSFITTTIVLVGSSGVIAQLCSYGFWGFMLGALISFSIRRRLPAS
jgi:hypothetical protein